MASSWARVSARRPSGGEEGLAANVTSMRFSLPSKTGQGRIWEGEAFNDGGGGTIVSNSIGSVLIKTNGMGYILYYYYF